MAGNNVEIDELIKKYFFRKIKQNFAQIFCGHLKYQNLRL